MKFTYSSLAMVALVVIIAIVSSGVCATSQKKPKVIKPININAYNDKNTNSSPCTNTSPPLPPLPKDLKESKGKQVEYRMSDMNNSGDESATHSDSEGLSEQEQSKLSAREERRNRLLQLQAMPKSSMVYSPKGMRELASQMTLGDVEVLKILIQTQTITECKDEVLYAKMNSIKKYESSALDYRADDLCSGKPVTAEKLLSRISSHVSSSTSSLKSPPATSEDTDYLQGLIDDLKEHYPYKQQNSSPKLQHPVSISTTKTD